MTGKEVGSNPAHPEKHKDATANWASLLYILGTFAMADLLVEVISRSFSCQIVYYIVFFCNETLRPGQATSPMSAMSAELRLELTEIPSIKHQEADHL